MGEYRAPLIPSPRIVNCDWGKIQIEGHGTMSQDVKLFPGGASVWDWGKSSMRHKSGIRTKDVLELLEHGAKVIILATGYHERVKVQEETITFLKEHQVQVHIVKNDLAVIMYNNLAEQGRPVGALIHSCC